MANTVRSANRRMTNYTGSIYVDGNTVRRVQTTTQPRTRELPQERKKQLSQVAQRNRSRAMDMSPGFVLFLAVVGIAILFTCVNYLQMKSEIIGKAKTVASLETELSQLKADNDAYESQVNASADLDRIKSVAIGKLGMNYPKEDQVIKYQTQRGSYVRQYQNVPSPQ